MPRKKTEINWEKLKDELKQRNISLAEASVKMGYGITYLNRYRNDGPFLPENAIVSLENMFNIKRESILVDQDKPKANQVDMDQLYKVIYDAVYQATKMAIKENIPDVVKKSVKDAWREA